MLLNQPLHVGSSNLMPLCLSVLICKGDSIFRWPLALKVIRQYTCVSQASVMLQKKVYFIFHLTLKQIYSSVALKPVINLETEVKSAIIVTLLLGY